MKCVVCKHGETVNGNTSVVLEKAGATLVFKHVPAEICTNCGETYIDENISGRLLSTANEVLKEGVRVDIREYKAA